MNILFYIFFVLVLNITCYSQAFPGRYRIEFTDKLNSSYSTEKAEEFLSERAISRRIKSGITISEEDIPINNAYLNELKKNGIQIINSSKWFNSALCKIRDTSQLNDIYSLPFIKKISYLSPDTIYIANINKSVDNTNKTGNYLEPDSITYGMSFRQLEINQGIFLHKRGFTGEGILIAVLDAGFYKVDIYKGFIHLWTKNKIINSEDFVSDNTNIFRGSHHGLSVLSLLASKINDSLIGSAPDASYLLLRTENENSEYPSEEENWIAAAEFADSAGADIISSSLGYSTFDDSIFNYSPAKMNGSYSRISKAATIAFSKGMLIISSAGNMGDKAWGKVSSPADCPEVLSVGSVNSFGKHSSFSSYGPTADGRIKPDIMAMGQKPANIKRDGRISNVGQGTSYSAPIISGLSACLWQAFPYLTNKEIINAILKSSSQYNNPDTIMGFGIPDFKKAFLNLLLADSIIHNTSRITIYPNPTYSELKIDVFSSSDTFLLQLYNSSGNILFENKMISDRNSFNSYSLDTTKILLMDGFYFARFVFEKEVIVKQFVKFSRDTK